MIDYDNAIEVLSQLRKQLLAKDALKSSRQFVPHKPWPKQKTFLDLDCYEALYGGAAGGGKSDALLMAALQYVHVPGYSALLLRRTFADLSLPGAVMARAHDWLGGTPAHWDGLNKQYRFPSGATLTFGYLDNANDKYRYKSAEFQFVGFDELTQFPKDWYVYLSTRIRRPKESTLPLRLRGATNPGDIGHDWVRRRFIDKLDADYAEGLPEFVPATLEDNPSIDAEAYRKSLALVDANTRRQLLEGVWVRDGSGLVYAGFDEARNTIASIPPKLDNYLLGIDYGVTDATAFVVMGWRSNDPVVYIVESFKETQLYPSQAAEITQELNAKYKFIKMVGDVGGMGKAFVHEARRRFHIPIDPAEKVNKRGYISLFNGDLERGRIRLGPNAQTLANEWLELPWNKAHTDHEPGFDDHESDAALYGWRACNAFTEKVLEEDTMDPRMRAMLEAERRLIEADEREVRKIMREGLYQ